MVTLNRIYTRTGDAGSTGLASGERVAKTDARVTAIGDVDEANACIGVVRLHLAQEPVLDPMLGRIQNELFDLGADLASPERPERPLRFEALRVTPAQVERLERDIDVMNAELAPLTSFVLPAEHPPEPRCMSRAPSAGGRSARPAPWRRSRASRCLQRCWTYLNRLSDLLFVAARYANGRGAAEVLWRPGATRGG